MKLARRGPRTAATRSFADRDQDPLGALERLLARAAQGEERRGLLEEAAGLLEAVRVAERERLAGELHDGPTQAIGGARLELTRIAERERGLALEPLIERLGRAFDELRDAARGLGPRGLGAGGIRDALRRVGRELASATGAEVSVEVDADAAIPSGAEADLLRFAEEAAANVCRHARARRAAIGLVRLPGGGALRVEDDGVGFRSDAAASRGGLSALARRARRLGARLTVDSRPGRGTRVEVAWGRAARTAAAVRPRRRAAHTSTGRRP